ncbi:hypothetical protein ACF0H5_015543 [Mactra antiquata]
MSTVLSGRTLHYNVRLAQCSVIKAGDGNFIHTFGGRTEAWRTFNDREISAEPFVIFFDQKTLLNSDNKLFHVVRDIEIWGNDTGIVRTVVYSTDYRTVISVDSRKCTLGAQNQTGDINFETNQVDDPEHINSFSDVVKALDAGRSVHFQAMSFLCRGGREHTFSDFGGRMQNYELPSGELAASFIQTSVASIVHYDIRHDMHVLDVINVNMLDNRTVEIIDTRERPSTQVLIHQHTSYCTLETGAPGGTFNVYAN